jgi:hypothetical protein
MPVNDRVRRLEIAWGYRLANGAHLLRLRLLDPRPGDAIQIDDLIAYGDKPLPRPY